jgi:hypothetical protein
MALETDEPLVALGHKSIHTRCAACRDLSRVGTLDALPTLISKAGHDKSPAVRLCAAGAVADILSRHRVGAARELLGEAARADLLRAFNAVDPGVNAGLFPMLACLDHPQSFARIATGLRDPRGDVRVGAGVGLLRLCISGARRGDLQLEADLLNLLHDKRLKPDAVVEVARVCVAGGYASALARLSRISLGDSAHAATLLSLQTELEALSTAPEGVWWSDGCDAGEVREEPVLAQGLRVLLDDGGSLVWLADEGGWQARSASDGLRRMHFRRVGQPSSAPVLQDADRTWYQTEVGALETLWYGALGVATLDWTATAPLPEATALAGALLPSLQGTAEGDRMRAILLQRAGETEKARSALEGAVS